MDREHTLVNAVKQQSWLDQAGDFFQSFMEKVFQGNGKTGQKVADGLHGKWLGHPLHPVLTDIPTGSYTAALGLDILEMATGDEAFGKGADAAIAIGMAGAASSAVTGMVDWQHTVGASRKIGTAHALLNSGSLACYMTSFLLRKGGYRPAGRGLALLGYSAMSAAAYLGGHLVFNERIGVDHAPDPGNFPEEFTPVMDAEELPEGKLVKVKLKGLPVLLARRGPHIYAIAETCSHLGGPLSKGELTEDNEVVCPWHGSHFSLEDGSLKAGPSVYSQPCLETRVEDGRIELRAARKVTISQKRS